MRSEDDDDEDGDGDGDEDGDGDGNSTGNDKSSVVRHSSQFIIYECVDMELFLVFIMATLLRAAHGGGDGGLRRTWGLGIAVSLSPSMSANFQITCDQERPLSLPERLANICLISEMTDLTVDQARLPASLHPLLSLFPSLSLTFSPSFSLSLSIVAAGKQCG